MVSSDDEYLVGSLPTRALDASFHHALKPTLEGCNSLKKRTNLALDVSEVSRVEGGGGGRFNARGQLQRRVAAGGARTRCPPVYFCERVGGIGGVPPIEEIQPPTLLSGECVGDS